MVKVAFIIVNYLCFEYSINCVESLKKQDREDIDLKIVIVDNCSPNDSFLNLTKKFEEDTMVNVIQTESNIGYARAMNFGYSTCHDCDFIICANDDIEFPKDGLFNWIIQKYKETAFAVLGPDVYSVNGKFHQSPGLNHSLSSKEIKRNIIRLKINIIKVKIRVLLNLQNKSRQSVTTWENDLFSIESDSYTLHGALLVFSPLFFEFYSLPFDSGTYFYGEENLLRLRCDQRRLKMLYSPSFEIIHYQAVSTIAKTPDDNKRALQRLKTSLVGEKRFLEVLTEGDKHL